MIYLSNAFSLQMIAGMLSEVVVPQIEKVSATEVAGAEFVSVVGHPDTAAVVGDILGKNVVFNRCNLSLSKGDVLYVAQLMGGRLPEGATTLPEGFTLEFIKVTL